MHKTYNFKFEWKKKCWLIWKKCNEVVKRCKKGWHIYKKWNEFIWKVERKKVVRMTCMNELHELVARKSCRIKLQKKMDSGEGDWTWGVKLWRWGWIWADIAHGGKSLHIAFGDIDAVMFEGFQGWGKLVGWEWLGLMPANRFWG